MRGSLASCGECWVWEDWLDGLPSLMISGALSSSRSGDSTEQRINIKTEDSVDPGLRPTLSFQWLYGLGVNCLICLSLFLLFHVYNRDEFCSLELFRAMSRLP